MNTSAFTAALKQHSQALRDLGYAAFAAALFVGLVIGWFL